MLCEKEFQNQYGPNFFNLNFGHKMSHFTSFFLGKFGRFASISFLTGPTSLNWVGDTGLFRHVRTNVVTSQVLWRHTCMEAKVRHITRV